MLNKLYRDIHGHTHIYGYELMNISQEILISLGLLNGFILIIVIFYG